MAAQEEEEAVALAAFEGLSFGGDSPPPAANGQQHKQEPGVPAKARSGGGAGLGAGLGGPRRFFARLLGLLGGEQEAATLVRTASFRDKDHLENPINGRWSGWTSGGGAGRQQGWLLAGCGPIARSLVLSSS